MTPGGTSNETHADCLLQIQALQARLTKLEEENVALKRHPAQAGQPASSDIAKGSGQSLLVNFDPNGIQDLQGARQLIVMLMNLIEDLSADLRDALTEIQRLRDENNRLKGEQGKPSIKANTCSSAPTDHSSELERRKPGTRSKQSKKETIRIDREEKLKVDPTILPPDAQFKGYEEVVVQDIVFRTDNVRFLKEKYYAASTSKTYLAPLPRGYQGEFGPRIKALTLALYFGGQMSEPKILELFGSVQVKVSAGQLSNWLIKNHEMFHAEKGALYEAGLRGSPWQHLDATGTRVNGQNHHCHVVCNPLYTVYHTTESKDRLSVLDVLRNGRSRIFRFNAEAQSYLQKVGLSEATRQTLTRLPWDQQMDEATLLRWLDEHLGRLGPRQRKWILDATAVAAYHAQVEFPVVRLLVCDDAPQFNWVTQELALCWIHEGRHYKKLTPVVAHHRKLLEDFLKRFWSYYDDLLTYRKQPSAEARARLAVEFDLLFSTVTGYQALDERIARTKAKKEPLLMVLIHPEIPLHNNSAELGARARVRKRDVSFGPRTPCGARAWDTFMTLAATTQKLGVSFYHYLRDRISGANQIPSLATLIQTRANQLHLGASWDTS